VRAHTPILSRDRGLLTRASVSPPDDSGARAQLTRRRRWRLSLPLPLVYLWLMRRRSPAAVARGHSGGWRVGECGGGRGGPACRVRTRQGLHGRGPGGVGGGARRVVSREVIPALGGMGATRLARQLTAASRSALQRASGASERAARLDFGRCGGGPGARSPFRVARCPRHHARKRG
jgi:hypothetical protein